MKQKNKIFMKKLFLAICVCAGLCACTDDAIEGTSSSNSSFEGDVAYLTVKIKDVGAQTRAVDDGFEYGTQDEYAVSNAYFYFYDEQGLFVSRAEVWNGGSVGDGTDTNVEFEGSTVIVLKGLTGIGFPRYMVTVLNEPSNFEDAGLYEPAATLDEMQTKLAHASEVGIYDALGNFVMSTSAYNDGTSTEADARAPWYFVTTIEDSNFREEPYETDDSPNPVEVYVERLAAKVEVDLNSTYQSNEITIVDEEGDEHTVYRLEATIAGEANADGQQVQVGTDINGDPIYASLGTDHIYIELLGWTLNGTARSSNIVKDITGLDITNGVGGWTSWNSTTNHRSYWGKSFNYGLGTYPTTNINPTTEEPNTDEDEASSDTWLNDYLKYTSLNDDVTLYTFEENSTTDTRSHYAYCAENTNITDILGSRLSSGITNVLIKAQGWIETGSEDVSGNPICEAVDLIRCEGMLFTQAAFQQYIVNLLLAESTAFNAIRLSPNTGFTPGSTWETEGLTAAEAEELFGDEWKPISYEYLTLENEGNGLLYIEFDIDTFIDDLTSSTLLWQYSTTTQTYICIPGGDDDTPIRNALEGIDSSIESLNESLAMNGYNAGLMYYSIPIEHLNESNKTIGIYDGLAEANYGIVRNHWYELSINSLTQVGTGIWAPDEVIIPDPTESTYYYVGADIHILSWHLVDQGVDL